MMRLTIALVLGVVLSVFLVAQIIAYHYTKHSNPAIVGFNSQKMQAQIVHQLARRHASKEQATQASLQIKTLLQNTLKDYSKTHQVIIVESRLLLAGSKDITDIIFKQMLLTVSLIN